MLHWPTEGTLLRFSVISQFGSYLGYKLQIIPPAREIVLYIF